jgi:hypothetical protein
MPTTEKTPHPHPGSKAGDSLSRALEAPPVKKRGRKKKSKQIASLTHSTRGLGRGMPKMFLQMTTE